MPVRNQQLSGEPTRDRRKPGGRRSAAAGFEQSRFRPRGREAAPERLEGFCRMLAEALAIAGKDLARLILARELMTRATAKCRRNSRLPKLVELFLSRPQVTVPLAAKRLRVTPRPST